MQLSVLRQKLQADWKHYALYGGLLAVLILLLGLRLGSLLPGFSEQEITVLQSGGLRSLLDNPVNAPYYVLMHGLSFLNQDYLLWGRIVSVICGALTLILFCGLVWHWHGRRNAILGTILFGTSAWFLHAARWGTPDVLLFFVLALVVCYLWLHNTGRGAALLTAFILVAIALYIPGMVWFIAAGVILRWKSVDQAFRKNLWAVTAGGIILLAATVPLALAIYKHPEVAKTLLGLPTTGWPQLVQVLQDLVLIPFHIFAQAPVNPERWLGDVAIVDVFTAAMFILGCYLYLRYIKLKRVQLSLAVLIIGAVLSSLGGSVTLTLLIPFIYIIAAAGIGFMLDRWLDVFPRNSLAQWAGYILIALAITSACVYSLSHYFIGWPQAKATRMIYTQHQLR
jgi:4-amino-4-deoxy-L-arabinose transferase-like glycosyltransferase